MLLLLSGDDGRQSAGADNRFKTVKSLVDTQSHSERTGKVRTRPVDVPQAEE